MRGRKSTSTWISRNVRAFAIFGAALALAGCDGGGFVTRAAPERIVVADRSVVVAGPPGYCVDPVLSRDSGATAFVLMGSCAAIAGSAGQPAPRVPAILTVSVSADLGGGPDMDELRAYIATPEGRAALSRSGDPSSLAILETRSADDVLYILARDSSGAILPGVSNTYWRALFDLNGRLVTAAVVGIEQRPITRDTGFSTLESLTERLRRENARVTIATRGV